MTPKKILIGTQNPDKLKEIRTILSFIPDIETISLDKIASFQEIEETGSTYEENAFLKAESFSKMSGLPCIADDTGLEVDFLGGKPGIHSARWAGVVGKGRYEANNEKLLNALMGVPPEGRKARFVCVMVLVYHSKCLLSCRGECQGTILTAARGVQGFGYDPLFEEAQSRKTFAEMDEETKNRISHRARALAEFVRQFSTL